MKLSQFMVVTWCMSPVVLEIFRCELGIDRAWSVWSSGCYECLSTVLSLFPWKPVVSCTKTVLIWDSACRQDVHNKCSASQLVSCNENVKSSQRKQAENKAPAPFFRWNKTKKTLQACLPYCSVPECVAGQLCHLKLLLLCSSFCFLFWITLVSSEVGIKL